LLCDLDAVVLQALPSNPVAAYSRSMNLSDDLGDP